ncbi:MAG: outer membrane protein assembly factor BamD [Pseudomonadota bacterium]
MKQSVFYRAIQLSLAGFLVGFSAIAHAALFEDDEARRAILDLRQKLDVTQQGLKSQADDIAVLRRALFELQNQIEALKAEQSALRGANEQLLRELTDIQLKQKDVLQTVDTRLSKFEPVKVVLDGLEFQADPAEKREFETSLAVFRTGDFAAAQNSLLAFLRKYPTSGYASSTLFWLGNAQYATKDYKESIVNFRKLLSIAPQHARAAEAMLAISNCLVELKDIKAAKKAMEDLVKQYPTSEAAQTAKDRLARLR